MSIHLRLALWYSAVLAITLVLFGLTLYIVRERDLTEAGDNEIASRAHHIASTVRFDFTSRPTLAHVELPPIDAFESPGVYVQVLHTDYSVAARSDNLGGSEIPVSDPEFGFARSGRNVFYTTRVGDDQVRVYVQPLIIGGNLIGFVQVGRSTGETNSTLHRLRLELLGLGAVSIFIAGGIAWAIAGEALRPIASLTRTARAIAQSKSFSRRLEDVGSRDEMGELGVTFNEMLTSLEDAYASQQRFITDASHELRTPLTTVQANLELLDRQGDGLPPPERKALVRAAVDETERMSRLVADLLSLARADAGQTLQMRLVELDRLLLQVYGEAKLLARDVRLAVGGIDEVYVTGDPDRLKQLILILVDNAIKYTPSGGRVILSLQKDGPSAVVTVADTGIGISPEDLPHIFDRFYRAEKARSSDQEGTGLGLAIARWVVDQHEGEISVESQPGQGSTFIVRFPQAPSSAARPVSADA